ncbi:unnamed protein product [Polarella glacialis]|uniref:Pathogen-related protein n=1 Tax=Polarella glacialis TaxID=89957 RepID=A0A813DY90_POLGL|nr:unnamed protein product [Polarella glacialis]|mmetsp:Transcript_50274/g.90333  ORF Transcript_50274/g.90333 Transcript_50274/m.90333 type:complete len:236 (+) Transcript_50274:90-797(+)|eukprot:CAMPEP_0115062266 /NCGR_PEP_ID=MMETSP0227-20121206/8449_1 /TAXON_ID=89957 /ORGANISM="Polarella glacialis, Strain CCMP 1383" /LENGTH=235 /DNA_ID=CAMNT_0002447623 /DNA_START=31 /DNA_END=738 /DNA_ORIENTATION=-
MALVQETDPFAPDNKGKLSEVSSGISHGELIRDYVLGPEATWRFSTPSYSRVNDTYFEHRAMKHPEGCLEAIVSKIVKNWEVESHHIADIHQWKTVDVSMFKAALNGGCPCSAKLMADVGHNNMLVGETQNYSAARHTFESSYKVFGAAFPEGFAWEVLEVYSGPPTIAFKWRHFGKMVGTYKDKTGKQHKGNGEFLNLIGMCIATVNESLVIETLDVYYNPSDMIEPLVTAKST